MTFLSMGDGPVANLPRGLDCYAGYVQDSGIGETWTEVQQIPAEHHLSISVIPGVPAMCGDVESGALTSWKGYKVGYTSIDNAQTQIAKDGRPEKLWTAHYTGVPHLCGPACGYGFSDHADGTQWTDHGGSWDESLLAADFFSFLDPPKPATPKEVRMFLANDGTTQYIVCESSDGVLKHPLPAGSELALLAAVIPSQPSPMPTILGSIPSAVAGVALNLPKQVTLTVTE